MVPNILRTRKSTAPTGAGQLATRNIINDAFPLPEATPYKGERLSGDNLTPSDGYSSLFTSGLLQCQNGQVENTFPSASPTFAANSRPTLPPRTPRTNGAPSAFSRNQHRPAAASSSTHRRRSSILNAAPTSPAKYKAPPAEIALENGMRQLRVSSSITTTPSPSKQQSRWSSSSEETIETAPRRSGESVRSKLSGVVSLRSRKSEERMRPNMEELMDVDPVPPVPKMPEYRAPVTPGRLAKLRNLLTPKKKQVGCPPTPAPSYPLPPIPAEVFTRPPVPTTPGRYGLPQPPAADRTIPKKGSFASLKSLAKKGSSTTLRGLFKEEAQPVPRLPPATPSRQYLRPAKSSIGPPSAQPSTSPSVFLNEMPRQAPTTPRKDTDSVLADILDFDFKELDLPDMSFSTTPGYGQTPPIFTPRFASASTSTPSTGTPLAAKAQRDRTKNRILPYTDRINASSKFTGWNSRTPPKIPSGHSSMTSASSSKRSTKSTSGNGETWQSSNDPENLFGRLQAGLALGKPAHVAGPSRTRITTAIPLGKDLDSSTFGRRSETGSHVDFTASPGKRGKKMSDASMASSLSGDGTEDWELERFLKEVESKEHMARQSGRF